MLFSNDPKKRHEQVMDLLYVCTATRGSRETFYNECMDYYMKGGANINSSRANKIKPIVKRQSAFLYTPDSVKFWVNPSPEEDSEEVYQRTDAVSQAVSMSWADTGVDMKFSRCVEHSLVNGSYIMGVLPRLRSDNKVELVAYDIHPKYFGVYREDIPDLENQQAVSLTSYYTIEEIEHRIMLHPKRDQVLHQLETMNKDPGHSGENVIIMGPGAQNYKASYWTGGESMYNPNSPVTYYAFRDLYAFDDRLGDYRVFTVTGDTILYDRPIKSIGIPGVLPFVKVCGDELPEYFWGASLVQDLYRLQDWYTDRMDDVDNLIQQKLNPPTSITGAGQSYEEKLSALRKPGGKITAPQGATIQQWIPDLPEQLFEFMGGIDSMMTDSSGMRPSMFGKNEPGNRTEGMQASMMRVAGAEMRMKGLKIERQAEACAQLLFQYLRLYSKEKIVDEQGNLFFMAEFPDDAKVRVDGHSGSPLFVEDNSQLAMGLMRYGAITQETLVRMLHPVLEGKILKDLSKIQFAKLVAAEQMKLEQQQKRSGKAPAA